MSKSGVYQILNKVNGKYYVGSAIDIEERWLDHRYRFKTNKNSRYLQNAWNKHGEEAFQFNVLEYVQNPEWLIEIEQYWIDFLEASNPKFGYNICPIAVVL
jgi:group I intron endonuclease